MSESRSPWQSRLDALVRDLPRDISTETDLWPRIAACIGESPDGAIAQLPRSIEPARDLWPRIQAQLSGRERHRRVGLAFRWPNVNVAAAAGMLTVAALVLSSFMAIRTPLEPESVSAPAQIAAMLADLPHANLQQTARSLERDFIMLRGERLRIEQALVSSENDSNLREQWRRVYLAELKLIDAAEKLAINYGTGSAI